MRAMLVAALLLAAGARAGLTQTAADSAAIQATAHDYIDGWWTGDALRDGSKLVSSRYYGARLRELVTETS
jgi:hypothetical protein